MGPKKKASRTSNKQKRPRVASIPRNKKSPATKKLHIGNCIVEFPTDAQHNSTSETFSVQVGDFKRVEISLHKKKVPVPEVPSPCEPDNGTRNPAVTTFTIGNCIVEFPTQADHTIAEGKLSLQANLQVSHIRISVDKGKSVGSKVPKSTEKVRKSGKGDVGDKSKSLDSEVSKSEKVDGGGKAKSLDPEVVSESENLDEVGEANNLDPKLVNFGKGDEVDKAKSLGPEVPKYLRPKLRKVPRPKVPNSEKGDAVGKVNSLGLTELIEAAEKATSLNCEVPNSGEGDRLGKATNSGKGDAAAQENSLGPEVLNSRKDDLVVVDRANTDAYEVPSPCIVEKGDEVDKAKCLAPEVANSGLSLPSGCSFHVINPRGLHGKENELLEMAFELYKQELPTMRYAADTGKESDYLRNCTMDGKYCSLLLKRRGEYPADKEIVIGVISYQVLPTGTQFAEVPLAAIDQSYHRQGLGKLLVRELVRRLMDVGIRTLFVWGDQLSEPFWNKLGCFRSEAEVDAHGKSQKLGFLRNEVRKAMTLPGNSFLMRCELFDMNTITSKSVGGSPQQKSIGTPAIKKDVRTAKRKATSVGSEKSEVARAEQSDPYSLGDFFDIPLAADVSPASATTPNSRPSGGKFAVKTYLNGSNGKVSVTINSTLGSMSAPSKSNRTLRFAEKHSTTATKEKQSETALSIQNIQASVATEEKLPETSPLVGIQTFAEKLAETFPMIERVQVQGAPSDTSGDAIKPSTKDSDVDTREPLGDVQNVCEQDAVASRKKRRKGEKPQVTVSTGEPRSTDTGCGNENMELDTEQVPETDGKGALETPRPTRKRLQAEALPDKALGRRSVRKRKSDNTPIVNTTLQTPEHTLKSHEDSTTQKAGPAIIETEPLVSRPSISGQIPTGQKAEPQTPVPRTPVPDAIPEQVSNAPRSDDVNDVAVHNEQTDLATGDSGSLSSEHSLVDDLVTPSKVGEEQLNTGLQKQRKDSTIRKRLSSRVVHVPEVGEDASVASGRPEDAAKAATPIIYVMTTPRDPSKKIYNQHLKMVEKLGAKVSSDGSECTHVVTSELRRTINFCAALCSGAWVVHPGWLIASNKAKLFVDEAPFILRDKQYESKYNFNLATSIKTAQQRPRSLFAGYSVYRTPNVHTPQEVVTTLTKAAGGKVLSILVDAVHQKDPSHAIVLACDEDKKERDAAAKAGLRIVSGEWFMQSIVKQKIDFDTAVTSE